LDHLYHENRETEGEDGILFLATTNGGKSQYNPMKDLSQKRKYKDRKKEEGTQGPRSCKRLFARHQGRPEQGEKLIPTGEGTPEVTINLGYKGDREGGKGGTRGGLPTRRPGRLPKAKKGRAMKAAAKKEGNFLLFSEKNSKFEMT